MYFEAHRRLEHLDVELASDGVDEMRGGHRGAPGRGDFPFAFQVDGQQRDDHVRRDESDCDRR